MDGNNPKRNLKRALDIEAMNGLRFVRSQKDLGSIACNFIVPDRFSDKDGNWQAGAIATLIDSIGVGVNYYATGIFHATVELSISYLSTARIQEEVEIEVKVLRPRGKLSLVMVEIRNKEDGKLIALASVKANLIQIRHRLPGGNSSQTSIWGEVYIPVELRGKIERETQASKCSKCSTRSDTENTLACELWNNLYCS